jgi:hypothetical protein
MFLTDLMTHLQYLNLQLQDREKIISDLIQCIFSFQTKIGLFQKDLRNRTYKYFVNMSKSKLNYEKEKLDEYETILKGIFEEFEDRFVDLRKFKSSLKVFLNPFEINLIHEDLTISDIIMPQFESGELELIEMQEDMSLKSQFKALSVIEFWGMVSAEKYPILKNAAYRILSIFGTTYVCESFYSTLKSVKSKNRSILTNQHLKELLRTAETNYHPDFKELAKEQNK